MVSATLIDLLDEWSKSRPDKVACRFLADGESESGRLTYTGLHKAVEQYATLLSGDCAPGSRVALLFTPSLDFLPAFLGVLRAGCVAVPLPPPAAAGVSVGGLRATLRDAEPAALITNLPPGEVADWLEGSTRLISAPAAGDRAPAPPAAGALALPPPPKPEDLALLQYTSGSTGNPKGVVVTHANLMANQDQMRRMFRQDDSAVVVSWLPVYHDMGLIGGILHPLYLGATSVLMPPEAFLRKPVRWLRTLTRHRGTISPAPDFAYALCARTVPPSDLADLDLTSWQVACCGSEPVRAATVETFSRVFQGAGFRPEAFCPSYGMAEATLLVSAAVDGAPQYSAVTGAADGDAENIVSCGAWGVDDLAVVVDGERVPEGIEGEIWLHGPNVAVGYWRDAERTAETFGARLRAAEGEKAERTYLRTGDLGFVRDGGLHITGRIKDLLIIRGRNYHPHDIESTVQDQDPRLIKGGGAVFTATTTDTLVVVQSVRGRPRDAAELASRVRSAVAREHGLNVTDVVLVRPTGVMKTTSGKIRRTHCRELYLARELPVVWRDGADHPADGSPMTGQQPVGEPAIAPGEATLRELLGDVLELSAARIDFDQPLSAMGMDSVRAMRIQQLMSERLGVLPPIDALLGEATPRALLDLPSGEPPSADASESAAGRELTRGQHALWFLAQWNEGGSTAYVLHRAVELLSDVTDEVLREAAAILVLRHAQLRSRFVERQGRVVRERWEPGQHDWFRTVDVADAEDLDHAVADEAARPVALATDPLFRMVLFRSTGRRPVLLLVASHLVADLYSFSVILGELGRLCDEGPSADLLPAPEPFERAVAAERAFLKSTSAETMLNELVADLRDLPTLPLPGDGDRAVPTKFIGNVVTRRIPGASRQDVQELARTLGCTPFAVLLAVLHAFLDRVTGQEDIVIGVPTALRSRAPLARTVGYLVNMVPMRVRGGTADSLADRAKAARAASLHSLARAEVPMPVLVERLGVPRDPSVSPIFNVTCGYYDDDVPGPPGLAGLSLEVEGATAHIGGTALRAFPLPNRSAVTDLDVTFGFVDGDLAMRFNYSTEVFATDTARALADSLAAFAVAAVADAHAAIAELPLWEGDTGVALPAPLTVEDHSLRDLLEERIRTLPDAPAMVHADRTWTYGELGVRTAAVARRLASTVHRDRQSDAAARTPVVGLFFGGEPLFVVGMLAALRAGYGFMPLPPDLPDERVRFMLADSAVTAVFAPSDKAARVRALAAEAGMADLTVVGLDEPEAEPTAEADAAVAADPPPIDQGPGSIAYIVYTSGTTGMPKGVIIPDSGVLPLLRWQEGEFGARPGMRMAQTCALSFDVGIQELLTVLMFGGAICIPLTHERYSARDYGAFLARDGVNAMYATPTFVRELVSKGVRMTGIRVIQIAGELLTKSLVEDVRPLFAPDCRIYNGYGPTETSINCAMHLVPPGDGRHGDVLPVGRPTGLARLYVLDRHRRPMPPLVRGEVYIGGPGVGLGYLNRAEETQRRFVPDAVAADGSPMYRTGDFGRFLDDGTLMITGRIDDQVKIRGYRVEPGEVEAALQRDPGVKDCAVVVDRSGSSPRLLAGVTGEGLSVSGLHRSLTESLPAYMVPARIAVLESLPRTRHGKLDTARMVAEISRSSEPPGTGGGRFLPTVVRIWCETLNVPDLDVDANFFELGGSSLSLAEIAAKVKREAAIDVPIPTLFQFPSARSLAAHLEILSGDPGSRPATAQPLGVARQVRGRQRTS